MRQDAFEARYAERWRHFDDALKARRKKDAAPVLSSEEIPRRYREVCHHLALARDRQYSTALVERLETLMLTGHQALYGTRELGGGISQFLFGGFPMLVRKRFGYVLAATLLFFGPLLTCLIAVQFNPDFAPVVVSAEQLSSAQQSFSPASARLGLRSGAESDFEMFGYYVWNNVRIDFQCFAGGLLFGIGTIFFLLFNGLNIGTVAGHLTQLGYIETFWGFVSGHSAFELTGIVLSGAAGLMVGMALIAPERRTRFAALKERMPDIIGLVYGAALLTFMAAFIEAFWSASRTPPVTVKYALGIILWVLTISYLAFTARRGDDAA